MANYDFPTQLTAIWERAVAAYRAGTRGADAVVNADDRATLASWGISAQEMYDYAEDFARGGEPTLGTVIAEVTVRREYFLEVQHGRPSGHRIDAASLPAKTASVRGLEWLPRIVPKARAKLRGELPTEIMYGCGGDRNFLRQHDIHPVELLRAVWRAGDSDNAVYDWVEARARLAASRKS